MQVMEKQQLMSEFRVLIKSLLGSEEAIKVISYSTLMRWSNGTSTPRPEKVLELIRGLSEQHQFQQILEQLQQISEQLWPSLFLSSEARLVSSIIPSAFYSKVMETYAETPIDLLYEALCSILLLQALQQLDPMRVGMILTIVHCVPHSAGKVRGLCTGSSLRLPKNLHVERLYLFGAESLPGRAIASFQLATSQQQVTPYWISEYYEGQGGSAATAPILRAGQIGGGLLAFSPYENYFSEEVCNLLRDYAALLALAFPLSSFFGKGQLELGVFSNEQQKALSSLEEHIIGFIRSSQGLTREAAQVLALQEIIEELLS